MTSSPSHFPCLQFFRHLFLVTKVSSNFTQFLESSPIQVLFLREISPSPVHCPFWSFAAASLKQHVVLLNCFAQKRKFLLQVRIAPIPCGTIAARDFVEHCACPNFACLIIIRIKVKASPASTTRGRFVRSRVYRARGRARRIFTLQRATSGGCAAKPIACTAGGHPGRT